MWILYSFQIGFRDGDFITDLPLLQVFFFSLTRFRDTVAELPLRVLGNAIHGDQICIQSFKIFLTHSGREF